MTSASTYVSHAARMARFLEDREATLVGDREIARSRLEQRWGIASSIFYSLRYRPPKQIAVEIYARLCTAVEDSAKRQIQALEHDVFKARASGRSLNESAAREAEVLAQTLRTLAAQSRGGDGNEDKRSA